MTRVWPCLIPRPAPLHLRATCAPTPPLVCHTSVHVSEQLASHAATSRNSRRVTSPLREPRRPARPRNPQPSSRTLPLSAGQQSAHVGPRCARTRPRLCIPGPSGCATWPTTFALLALALNPSFPLWRAALHVPSASAAAALAMPENPTRLCCALRRPCPRVAAWLGAPARPCGVLPPTWYNLVNATTLGALMCPQPRFAAHDACRRATSEQGSDTY